MQLIWILMMTTGAMAHILPAKLLIESFIEFVGIRSLLAFTIASKAMKESNLALREVLPERYGLEIGQDTYDQVNLAFNREQNELVDNYVVELLNQTKQGEFYKEHLQNFLTSHHIYRSYHQLLKHYKSMDKIDQNNIEDNLQVVLGTAAFHSHLIHNERTGVVQSIKWHYLETEMYAERGMSPNCTHDAKMESLIRMMVEWWDSTVMSECDRGELLSIMMIHRGWISKALWHQAVKKGIARQMP